MLKLLHTADWHLGKKLGPYSRFEEQKDVMRELIETANREKVDAVLVAGDVFDQFSPSTEATELFYSTLKHLTDNGRRPVIVIAGNHDSPDRIQVSDPLARACGIILIGHPQTEVKSFDIEKQWEISRSIPGFLEITWGDDRPPLRILHTPFANEYRMKTYLESDDPEEQLRVVLQEHWQSLADEYKSTYARRAGRREADPDRKCSDNLFGQSSHQYTIRCAGTSTPLSEGWRERLSYRI